MIRAASNLLAAAEAWEDLRQLQRIKVANLLLLALEENAFLLAEVIEEEEYLEEAAKEIGKAKRRKCR